MTWESRPLNEAPERPGQAVRVLLDGEDEVYDFETLRWRYRNGKLIRVLKYSAPSHGWPVRVWGGE